MELTFLKKPSTEKITAVKWTGINKEEIADFCEDAALVKVASEIGEYFGYSVPTCGGNVIAKPGDFIIKLKKRKQETFEVWPEEKLNESYFSADDVNKAFLDIEKDTIAEKLNKLNMYISDPSKKAPYKKLSPVEQGFLLSEKEILESYLRTLLTHASYKYDEQISDIVFKTKSKVEHSIDLDSGARYVVSVTRYPGKTVADFKVPESEVSVTVAKATRYDATVKDLMDDLGDYLGFEADWYKLFKISESYLEQDARNDSLSTILVDTFFYVKEPESPSGD